MSLLWEESSTSQRWSHSWSKRFLLYSYASLSGSSHPLWSMMDDMDHYWNDDWQDKVEVIGQNSVLALLFQPYLPYELLRHFTWDRITRSQCLEWKLLIRVLMFGVEETNIYVRNIFLWNKMWFTYNIFKTYSWK